MSQKKRNLKFFGVMLIGGMMLSGTQGCVSSRTYQEIVETSVKTIAATLLDIIVIDNLQDRVNPS